MTKDEAINKLIRIRQVQGPRSEAHEALGMAIDALSQPSLPFNLDEAAEFDKMFEDFCDQHPDGLTLNECAEFFYDKGRQAGAKWMAGQEVIL